MSKSPEVSPKNASFKFRLLPVSYMPVRLPLDILHSIFEFVDDKETLRNLLTVSRLSKTVAEPLLYSDVEIKQNSSKDRIEQFCKTVIAGDGRLASRVKRLSITIHTCGSSWYSESINATLRRLVNIQRLCLDSALSDDPIISPPSFGLASLTHLIWEVEMDKTVEFAVFLESLPKLEYLQATSFSSFIALSPDALPNLRALVSSLPFAVSILPGRHVIHLDVDFDLYSPAHELSNELSLDTLNQVQTLVVRDKPDRTLPFVSRFNNVVYLMFFVETRRVKLDEILNGIDMLPQAKITYLKVVTKSRKGMFSAKADVQKIFCELPNLRVFDYCTVDKYDADEVCERFDRNGSSCTLALREDPQWGLWWQKHYEGLPALEQC